MKTKIIEYINCKNSLNENKKIDGLEYFLNLNDNKGEGIENLIYDKTLNDKDYKTFNTVNILHKLINLNEYNVFVKLYDKVDALFTYAHPEYHYMIINVILATISDRENFVDYVIKKHGDIVAFYCMDKQNTQLFKYVLKSEFIDINKILEYIKNNYKKLNFVFFDYFIHIFDNYTKIDDEGLKIVFENFKKKFPFKDTMTFTLMYFKELGKIIDDYIGTDEDKQMECANILGLENINNFFSFLPEDSYENGKWLLNFNYYTKAFSK